jgi:hypothetical protein
LVKAEKVRIETFKHCQMSQRWNNILGRKSDLASAAGKFAWVVDTVKCKGAYTVKGKGELRGGRWIGVMIVYGNLGLMEDWWHILPGWIYLAQS